MNKNKKYYIIAIVASALFITYLHYSTVQKVHALHDIYRELYYIPLLIGAWVFGLKGAFFTYLFVSALYIPYLVESWTGTFLFETKRLMYLLFSGIFAFLAGFLIDRDRRYRKQLEEERYLAGIGQVATTIVHDLKNPLITIQGFARRILEGKGNINAAAQAIIDSGQNMERVVHDVLDFAKPIKLDLKEEDARNVVNRACNSCKTKAEEQGVNFSIDLPADPVNIKIDSFHIERAIVNLINNAIEASHKGGNITIAMVHEKKYLVFRFKDQGSGMDRETLDNIFIPFYTKKVGGDRVRNAYSEENN